MGAGRAAAPVLYGTVPPLARSYLQRFDTGLGLADAARPGETIVLVPAQPDAMGSGKTQLAVGFAHEMWRTGALDLLVWVPAGSRTAVLASYAEAAADLDAGQPGETADAAARRFLSWLSRTRNRWAVVLDGVTSAADLDGLWPAGETGQVVVTSRLPEVDLSGAGRTVLGVPGFSMREAHEYLNSRLTGDPDQRIEALDLADDTGGIPISIAHAAAVVVETETTCRDYRVEYAERLRNTKSNVVDGCPPAMLAGWSLAVERAHERAPVGLAWPALEFAAVLDTGGIPAAVLTSGAACSYIAGRTVPVAGDDQLVRTAFTTLERFALVSVDKTSMVRTVWVHPAVRAAVRAYLQPGSVPQLVTAAANALLEAWPEAGTAAGAPLSQALRDSAASLFAYAGELLWQPEPHPVLLRAGLSLEESRLADSAISYWQSIAAACGRQLGHAHPQSALARDRLAAAYAAADRMAEAIPVFENALADRELIVGPEHPDAVIARMNLARSYQAAGREAEAIALYEQTLGQCERLFGSAHRDTLAVRAGLAATYQAAGRGGDGVRLYEWTLAESEEALGPAHRDTLTARASLAAAYLAAGQLAEAVGAYQRTLADRERVHGPDHPDTVAVRARLADAYRAAGGHKEALPHYERVLADRERIQGAEHPDTLAARGDLALAYRSAGKPKAAIPLYERTLADRRRLLGPDHRDTLSTRANLAIAYQLARRLRDAIPQYERAVSDNERVLGPGDIETVTTRCNLATAYQAAGRPGDMIAVLRRALADSEQYLGADHPMTATVRENLRVAARLPRPRPAGAPPARADLFALIRLFSVIRDGE